MLPRSYFLLPRLYLAVVFLFAAYAKLTVPVGFTKALTGFLSTMALQNASAPYKAFLQAVVLPHVSVFAPLVIAGELIVGITMLLGFATRAGAVVGIVLLSNYFLSKGLPIWASSSNDIPDIVLCILVLMSAAGRVFGVDQYLVQRFPRLSFLG